MLSLVAALPLFALPAFAEEAPADAVDAPASVEAPAPVAVVPPPREPAMKAPVHWSADESTTLVLVEDHRVPLVTMEIVLPVGTWSPWLLANSGDTAWEHLMYDADGQLRKRADALAIDVSTSCGGLSCSLSMSGLKEDLPAALELIKDAMASTSFDKDEIGRTQKGEKIGHTANEKDPSWRMVAAAGALAFEDGDARVAAFEAPEPLEDDSALLAASRDAMLRLPGRFIGFAGDLTREEVEALSKDLLPAAGAAPDGLDPVLMDMKERPATAEEAVENLTQIYFLHFRDGITWDDPNYAAWMVANHVLGGHFFSRLYVALRHEDGDTYGAGTRGGPQKHPATYGTYTFTRTENRQATGDKLQATLATFAADGITQDELDDTIGYLVGSEPFRRESPEQVLNSTLWALQNGFAPGFRAAKVEEAQALSLEQINAFIADYYNPAEFTFLEVIPAE